MDYCSDNYRAYKNIYVVFLASIILLSASCGGDNKTNDETLPPPTQTELPIPLSPHPQPTVVLSADNAVITASAIYRTERLLTRFLQLNAELDKAIPAEASTPGAALSLGVNFCASGDGLAQAIDASFAGGEQSVVIQLNECVAEQLSISGEISMAHYDDNGQDWLIINAKDVSLQFNNESAEIVEGTLRLSQTEANGETSITAVGSSLDVIISGFEFNLAPFESSVDLSSGTDVLSRHTVSITSELYGGLIFSKTSEPVLLEENGLASSGGNTLQGMGSAVIEWSAGTTFIAESTADSNTDLRDENGRNIIESSWADFLSAF